MNREKEKMDFEESGKAFVPNSQITGRFAAFALL